MPDDSFVLHQVDDPLERVFGTDGYLHGNRIGLQLVTDLIDHAEKISPHTVHLVDKGDTRHTVLVGLAPDGLRLGLHAADGTEHGHSTVEDTQRTLHLHGEVDMTGRVDDVDLVLLSLVFPECGGSSRGDGDPALLFLNHPVHLGSTVMHLTDAVSDPRIEKDPLRRGGLARINVGHDPDVPRMFETVCHLLCSPAP